MVKHQMKLAKEYLWYKRWIEEKFVQDCYEVVGFLAPDFQFSGL